MNRKVRCVWIRDEYVSMSYGWLHVRVIKVNTIYVFLYVSLYIYVCVCLWSMSCGLNKYMYLCEREVKMNAKSDVYRLGINMCVCVNVMGDCMSGSLR